MLKIHYYNIPDSEIGTWHEGQVYSPVLVLNRRAIVEGDDKEHSKIWLLLCAVILTAIRCEPGREVCYGLRLRSNNSSDGSLFHSDKKWVFHRSHDVLQLIGGK